jgi:hypothetical protein
VDEGRRRRRDCAHLIGPPFAPHVGEQYAVFAKAAGLQPN